MRVDFQTVLMVTVSLAVLATLTKSVTLKDDISEPGTVNIDLITFLWTQLFISVAVDLNTNVDEQSSITIQCTGNTLVKMHTFVRSHHTASQKLT